MVHVSPAGDGYFVTVGIDREVFALPVAMVVEILPIMPVFRIPEAPAHLDGLIDVRGRAVPVIDLRTRLGLPRIAPDENTRIVVLDVTLGERRLALGLVADRVFEVTALSARQIEPPPDIGAPWDNGHIAGVGRHGEGFVVVLDIVRMFSADKALLSAQRAGSAGSAGSAVAA